MDKMKDNASEKKWGEDEEKIKQQSEEDNEILELSKKKKI